MIRSRHRVVLLAIVLTHLAAGGSLSAQDGDSSSDSVNVQIWADFSIDKQFSVKFVLDNEAGVRTLASGDGDWTKLYTRGTFRYNPLGWLRFTGGVYLDWVDELDGPNSVELRPFVGALLRWDIRPRLRVDNYTRLESRNFFYSDGTSESDWRLRNRLRLSVAVNRATLSADRSLVAMADIELFTDPSEGLQESFSSTRRLQAGLSYRLNYSWRFVLLYTNQQSRTTTADKFESTDHIVRFRAMYSLPRHVD